MSNIKSYLPTFLKSLLIWVVPMLASFPFFDRTGKMVGNFWIFKLTVIIALALSTYLAFRKFYKTHSNWIQTSIIVIAVNVILDLVVLVGLLKMTFGEWFTQTLPAYLAIITAVNYLLTKKY
jgi:predicted Na+-dependent transporter